MNIDDWLTQCGDTARDSNAQKGIEEFRAIMENKKIYLWGAGSVVRLYLDLFEKAGVPVAGIIDKQSHGEAVEGHDVLPPSALSTLPDPANTIVITSVGSTMVASYIAEDFKALNTSIQPIVMGYRLFYALQNLICRCNVLRGEAPEMFLCPMCRTFGSACPILFEQMGDKRGGNLVLSLVAYGLGTICSLKCEHCIEGIPYVPRDKRTFVPVDTVKKDIGKLAEACDYIVRLDFCGGEPFLYPSLEEILDFSLAVGKIGYFYVITNGTVVPNDALCSVLRHPRIKVVISDYTGQLNPKLEENIVKTAQKLNQNSVSFEQRKHMVWSDMNSFKPRGLSSEQMENAYKACLFVNSRRLHEGVLYPCLHYFSGVQTGELASDPQECLRIHDIPEEQLSGAIHNYLKRPFVSACDRCMAPFDAPEVPAAEQMKEGIPRDARI